MNRELPITSYGIILIKIDLDKDKEKINKNIAELIEKYENIPNISNIEINNSNDLLIYNTIMNKIEFLMIMRKYTIGYIEFIRGNYESDNIDAIINLFKQMNQDEINNLENKDFDTLWIEFWNYEEIKIKKLQNEFKRSKEKFYNLKNNSKELNLDFYIKHIKPEWKIPEWGFPKGRKYNNETNIKCALREFCEETDYNESDILLLENIEPIEEEFMGTNGMKYKHIYYLAVNNNNKQPSLNRKNINQSNEIGAIDFFNYHDALKVIRSYHVHRKNLISRIYNFIMEIILKNIKILYL
jgi:ADP-ribose pyrophosphatase YjhB (NUDIX family)